MSFTSTYEGVAVVPGTDTLNGIASTTNRAVVTGVVLPSEEVVTFTLQNNINAENRSATLQAVLVRPSWALSSTFQGIVPTFIVWSNSAAPSVPVPAAAPISLVALTSAAPTSPSENRSTPATPSTTFPSSVTTPDTTMPSDPAVTSVPTANSTETSSAEPSTKDNSGLIAGAAVGCFLAGLIIACILAFIFYRRRSRRSKRSPRTDDGSSMDELHEVSFVNDVGFAKTWDKRLPQPDSDQSIAHLASRTLDEIELFVEEFYNNKPTIFGTLSTTSGLSSFDSPYLDASLEFLLQKAASPTVLIKHCIAFFLLQKIDPSSNVGKSLLPREYIIPNSTATSSHESRQAISQIRVLMANTRSNPNHDQQYVLQRDQVAGEAIRQIEQAFQPWVRGDSSKRSSALKGVVIHLSELGTKLFSQPSAFEWQWGRSNSRSTRAIDLGSNEIVVLPGLDKTTDQRAELLTTPICLVKPRTASWAE